MGEYNYSPAFLEAHKDTVVQLVALAREGRAASVRFETQRAAKQYRNLILNLKRSLAFNHPEMTFVYDNLRTATSYADGFWVITIGPETALAPTGRKMRGAHKMSPVFARGPTSAPPTLYMESFDPRSIPDTAKMATCLEPNGPKELIIRQELPPEAAEWFTSDERTNKETGLGFEVVSMDPYMHLRVVSKASA